MMTPKENLNFFPREQVQKASERRQSFADKITSAESTQLLLCRPSSDQSMWPSEYLISRLDGSFQTPKGYRVVSLVACKLPAEPSISKTPNNDFATQLEGQDYWVRALCLSETQYEQELHLKPQVVALIRQVRAQGEQDPQEALQQSNPAWRLFHVATEMSCWKGILIGGRIDES